MPKHQKPRFCCSNQAPPIYRSAFTRYRFPPQTILLAVRWYLRYGLSYRDVQELLNERGIEVDHVTIYRWVNEFTPILIDAARPCRHIVGNRWFVDETYVKVSGTWRYVYRAVDQHGQVIDVFVSKRRNLQAARTFFRTALLAHDEPVEVVTDLAQALKTVIEEQTPRAFHNTEHYANNRVECDHGRLKSRLRPMRGLKTDRTASVVISGHAFVQNLRRGHYELGTDAPHHHQRIVQASMNSSISSDGQHHLCQHRHAQFALNATEPSGLAYGGFRAYSGHSP